MLYQSPADFCAKYAKTPSHEKPGPFDENSSVDSVTVVSETPDTARIEALWFTYGHDPDSGYYDVFERIAIVLVKQPDGWRLHSEVNLGYE
jgi:ketosteroid isomerase-like protein